MHNCHETEHPYPPRLWWLKRGVLAGILVLGGLAALRWWWGREADRRLHAVIAAAQARGEPVLPADFETPQTSAETADKALLVAANQVVEGTNLKWLSLHDRLPLLPQAMEQIRVLSASNQQALDSVRRARALPLVNWGSPPGGELPPVLPGRSNLRLSALARLLRWNALRQHQSGNDYEAAELIVDLLHQQRVLDHGPATLIVHILALAVQERGTECVFDIAPALNINGSGQAAPGRSPATTQQVREIIRELMADEDSRRAGSRPWYEMRMLNIQTAGQVRELSPETGNPLLGPMYVIDEVRLARRSGEIADAASQPNWPAAEARLPRPRHLERSASDLECYARFLSLLNDFDPAGRVREFYHSLTDRRAAAIQLAIRLFRMDHGGEYPRSLHDLVPEYLPSVPLDPMAADDRPMGYRPDLAPPIVYSVGENGKDDGGMGKPGADRWAGRDAVYPLEPIASPQALSGDSEPPATRIPRPR